MQDKDYRDILSGQAKNGDIEEAKKTLLLIKGEEIKKVGLQRIAEAVAKSGHPDQALAEVSGSSDDKTTVEIIKELIGKDREKAKAVTATLKDPYYFARANILLAE